MRILIVDDNAEVRRLMKSLLADIALEIDECGDGADAVRVFRSRRPDWVLMDVFMKGMDGIAAAQAIRQIDASAKIVVVTNHTDKRTRRAAEQAGATAFFGKDDLLAVLSLLKS